MTTHDGIAVDAHVHLWRLARGDNAALSPAMMPIYRDLEPPDLKPRLDAAAVARVVVVQAAETLAETLFLLGLARKFSWIAGIIAWVEPGSPAIEEEVAALSWNGRVKGARPVRDDNRSIAWMLDVRLERGWQAVAAHRLSLDLLVQDWRELPLASELARSHPGIGFVLDHCAKPDIAGGLFEPWAAAIADFAGLPNVACKLSGLLNCAAPGADVDAIRPYADHVIDAFGAPNVMWASDWPPLDLAADYATWKRVSDALLADRSPTERAAILGGTACRVYRLDPSPEI
jgi:L-fuconolactonase